MAEKGNIVLCAGEEVEIFEGGNRKDIQKMSAWSKNGFVKPVNGNWIYPLDFLECDKILYNFQFKPTDVIVNGYLKCGTTWIQEIVWTILHNPDLNHPKQEEIAFLRVPWFEADMFKNINGEWFFPSIAKMFDTTVKPCLLEIYESIPNPRILKTHMHSSTVNQDMLNIPKMIYVARNPLDSFRSFYMFYRYFTPPFGFTKDVSSFADHYMNGEVFNGNAAEHMIGWWKYRSHENFYMIFYEDVKKDPIGEVGKLTKFLKKDLTEEQIRNVIHQSSFENMKATAREAEREMKDAYDMQPTEEQTSFFRKGQVGDSKNMPKEVYDKLAVFFK